MIKWNRRSERNWRNKPLFFLPSLCKRMCVTVCQEFFLLPNSNQFYITSSPLPVWVLRGQSSRAFKTICGSLSSFARNLGGCFLFHVSHPFHFSKHYFLILSLETKKDRTKKNVRCRKIKTRSTQVWKTAEVAGTFLKCWSCSKCLYFPEGVPF